MELQTKVLLSAVRKGNVNEVSKLIEQGVDVNSSLAHRNGNTALHTSVLLSNEEITKMLLKAGADMNLKNDLGFTPLNYSLDAHRLKIGQILMKAGGDINATNRNGERALEVAIKKCDDRVYNDFLSMSPNLNLETKEGNMLFETACQRAVDKSDFLTLIIKFLKTVPRSSFDEIFVDNLPLMHFVFENKLRRKQSTYKIVEFIQTFIKLGFNINVKDENENTLLYKLLSCRDCKEDSSVLRCLLESGADPNAKNRLGRTPLHNSCNLEINSIKLLADYKADFGVTDNRNRTPLHFLVDLKKSPNTIRFFIDQGESTVNINQKNNYGETALDIACKNMSLNIVRLLLDYGADIDWLKAFENYLKVVGLEEDISPYYRDLMFLTDHIDVNAVDSKGRSLLSFKGLRNDTWKFVIQHVAQVEALDHPINQSVYNEIHSNFTFKEFFTRCQKELMLAKKTYVIESSWVTYFQLLTGTKHQLKNYSGNYDLVMDIFSDKHEDDENLFPIYRNAMREKVNVGMELRLLFVKAAEVLSREIPIFDASSLISHETLDCILNKEDLSRIVNGH